MLQRGMLISRTSSKRWRFEIPLWQKFIDMNVNNWTCRLWDDQLSIGASEGTKPQTWNRGKWISWTTSFDAQCSPVLTFLELTWTNYVWIMGLSSWFCRMWIGPFGSWVWSQEGWKVNRGRGLSYGGGQCNLVPERTDLPADINMNYASTWLWFPWTCRCRYLDSMDTYNEDGFDMIWWWMAWYVADCKVNGQGPGWRRRGGGQI